MTCDRREFLVGSLAACCVGSVFAEEGPSGRAAALQAQIDAVTPEAWTRYRASGDRQGLAALEALDAAFYKVVKEIGEASVTDRPAVWFVYNMGFIVKTREALFSIDLVHPRATELVPRLDFALVTHNHDDHYTDAFFTAMDRSGKTVVQNFHCNYGAKVGGYTRAEKTFRFKDVTISTALTDHNAYLVDFTTTFEITAGGFTIYHTGDCATAKKFKLTKPSPDLWIVHPRCGLNPVEGASVIAPKRTLLVHLNEMGHARDRWRWTWQDGYAEQAKLTAAGHKAFVPLWGDRIV